MISDAKIIDFFCNLDDFMKEFKTVLTKNSISNTSQVKKRKRNSKMSKSEVITIMVIFHLKSHRNLKHFYLHYVCKHMNHFFPDTVSYNRFLELQKTVIQPLAVYLKLFGLGNVLIFPLLILQRLKFVITKEKNNIKYLKELQRKVMEH